jgi:hypothetical protein
VLGQRCFEHSTRSRKIDVLEGLTFVEGAQLALNLAAVIGGFSVWTLYVGNLKAALASKDAEISTLKTIRDDLKGTVETLEKRSPEYMERILSERIDTREAEIKRLAKDKESDGEKVQILKQEKAALKNNLKKIQRSTRGFMEVLSLEQEDIGNIDFEDVAQIEVIKLGEVGVDSGQLLITDPCYLENEWTPDALEEAEIYIDSLQNAVYQADKDFQSYEEELPEYGRTIQELIDSGILVKRRLEDSELSQYSYEGVCKATLDAGYGELAYRLGHKGAGLAFSTALGDGLYPIYGEKHDGRIVRVYVNVS